MALSCDILSLDVLDDQIKSVFLMAGVSISSKLYTTSTVPDIHAFSYFAE